MKKTVCVIGHTESTCNYITHQLMKFLSQHITVITWSTAQSQVPPPEFLAADIFVISNQNVCRSVQNQFPGDKPVLVANRVIGTEYLDKLFDLEPGSKVYVVGTTAETVGNTISILHSFGFRNFGFVPYYPGIQETLDKEIVTAVTTGLSYLVPLHIRTIIDLGGKGLNLSTFAQLLQYLEVPMTVLNDISHYYLETILHNTQEIRTMGRQSELLKNRLEVILDTVDEAIMAVDGNENVVMVNRAAETMLMIDQGKIIGQKLNRIVPGIDLSDCLKSGEGIRHELKSISEKHYFLNANVIRDEAKSIGGMVATLQPIQEIQELDIQIRRELKKKGNLARYTFEDIWGSSPELKSVISLAKRFAKTELTILLESESGAGKELFAQSIHNSSPRRHGPFMPVNFAAIPANLVESELFGYEDGAFTGARKGGKLGLFEEAHMGTIFLDEIGSASLDVQNRLLRVLEEREVRRIGSGKVTPVDVRVIAATNVDLERLVAEKKFREDLFYRLCTLPIMIPPLRDRKNDIMVLLKFFAAKHFQRELDVDAPLADFLTNYMWPGNVRELQNVVHYLCSVVELKHPARLHDIPPYLLRKIGMPAPTAARPDDAARIPPPLPLELADPKTAEFVGLVLSEIRQSTLLLSGVGWQTLIRRTAERAKVSEHQMKKWLRWLNRLGYVETGKTRQGTRITAGGEALLSAIQGKKGSC